jgi:hypothetical protein
MRKTFNNHENLKQSLQMEDLNSKKVHKYPLRIKYSRLVWRRKKGRDVWIPILRQGMTLSRSTTSTRLTRSEKQPSWLQVRSKT